MGSKRRLGCRRREHSVYVSCRRQ
jgi:hypothetical protein